MNVLPVPQVLLTGAVVGKAIWPSELKPVAWHRDADRARMKLGLYHKKGEVHDGEVEYKDITIEGPNGEFVFCVAKNGRERSRAVHVRTRISPSLTALRADISVFCVTQTHR